MGSTEIRECEIGERIETRQLVSLLPCMFKINIFFGSCSAPEGPASAAWLVQKKEETA